MPGADPDDYTTRLTAWLTGRQANVHPEISTTQVRAKPHDRATSAYTIAESDIEAALADNARLLQELNETARITMAIGNAANTTELWAAIGDLAQLLAPRSYALTELDAQRGECEGCGCCSQAGCHRLADATCPTNSLGDSVCPCTED